MMMSLVYCVPTQLNTVCLDWLAITLCPVSLGPHSDWIIDIRF